MTSRDGAYNAVGGISLAQPGVQLGQSEYAAWAATAAWTDLADVYLEKIEDGKYYHDDSWKDLEVRNEVIKVKGRKEDVIF